MFLCNPSSTNQPSSSSQTSDDSGTSVNDNTKPLLQQVLLQQQRQQEREQNQPSVNPTSTTHSKSPVKDKDDVMRKDDIKEHSPPQEQIDGGDKTTVVNVKTTNGDHWKMTAGASRKTRSTSRRRHKSGNPSEERTQRGKKESSDDDSNTSNPTQARGRQTQKRRERSEFDFSGKELHQMILNLESRISAMEKLTKEPKQVLKKVVKNEVLHNDRVELGGNSKSRPTRAGKIQDRYELAEDSKQTLCDLNSVNVFQGNRRPTELNVHNRVQEQEQHHELIEKEQQQKNQQYVVLGDHKYNSSEFAFSEQPKECSEKTEVDLDMSNFKNLENSSDAGNLPKEKQLETTRTIEKGAYESSIYPQTVEFEQISSLAKHPSQSDLSMDQGSKSKANLWEDIGSSSSNYPPRQEKNISEERECIQLCLQQMQATNSKVEEMSKRLDQVMTRFEIMDTLQTSNESIDQTELKTLYSAPRPAQDINLSSCPRENLLPGIREAIHFSVDASLRMQSIWAETQINDMQGQMLSLGRDILRQQSSSTADILNKMEDAQRLQQQQFQYTETAFEQLRAERSVFANKLDDFEKNLASSTAKTELEMERFRAEVEKIKRCISTDITKKIEYLSQVTASQAGSLMNLFQELDDSFTRTLEDFNKSLNEHKLETKEDARSLYSNLETKLNDLLESLLQQITMELKKSNGECHGDVEEILNKLKVNARETLEVIAARLDRTKYELFSVVEKENQLVRDLIYDIPTRDGCGSNHLKNYTFDFYISNFKERMTAATNNHGTATVVNGIIPSLDTYVHSCPWYIPEPVDTSFNGFVQFTDAGTIKVYLLFGRNPNEVGLKPRIGRAMTCSVTVTDLTGEHDDIDLYIGDHQARGFNGTRGAFIERKIWNETDINTNEKMGLFLGTVSCNEIIERKLNTPYAEGSVLLRYVVFVE